LIDASLCHRRLVTLGRSGWGAHGHAGQAQGAPVRIDSAGMSTSGRGIRLPAMLCGCFDVDGERGGIVARTRTGL